MSEEVLSGNKLLAYVLLKILKYCTGSSARSYQCKFAVQQVFKNTSIESMEVLGAAINEIIHYRTIRGKFSSVHPDLEGEGITKVEVGEKGLHFVTATETGSKYCRRVGLTLISLQITLRASCRHLWMRMRRIC